MKTKYIDELLFGDLIGIIKSSRETGGFFYGLGANAAATVTTALERTSQSRLPKQAQIYSRPVSTFAPFLQAALEPSPHSSGSLTPPNA